MNQSASELLESNGSGLWILEWYCSQCGQLCSTSHLCTVCRSELSLCPTITIEHSLRINLLNNLSKTVIGTWPIEMQLTKLFPGLLQKSDSFLQHSLLAAIRNICITQGEEIEQYPKEILQPFVLSTLNLAQWENFKMCFSRHPVIVEPQDMKATALRQLLIQYFNSIAPSFNRNSTGYIQFGDERSGANVYVKATADCLWEYDYEKFILNFHIVNNFDELFSKPHIQQRLRSIASNQVVPAYAISPRFLLVLIVTGLGGINKLQRSQIYDDEPDVSVTCEIEDLRSDSISPYELYVFDVATANKDNCIAEWKQWFIHLVNGAKLNPEMSWMKNPFDILNKYHFGNISMVDILKSFDDK